MAPLLWWACCVVVGCSTSPSTRPQDYWKDERGVVVTGPWNAIPPSSSFEGVLVHLCPAMLGMPRATAGQYGQEYCGAIYKTDDGQWWVSHLSPLGPSRTRRIAADAIGSSRSPLDQAQPTWNVATCYPPYKVIDSRHAHIFVEADVHNHPWTTPLSAGDLRDANQLWSIRVQLSSDCRIYKYQRGATERDDGEVFRWLGPHRGWEQIGIVKVGEDRAAGRITFLDGKSW